MDKLRFPSDLKHSSYFSDLMDRAISAPETDSLLKLIKEKNIFGWGTDRECLLQYSLGRWGPESGVILEIGSFKGRSTICFATGTKHGHRENVFAVDPHTSAPPWFPAIPCQFTLNEFESNLDKAGVRENVNTIVADSLQTARIWTALPIRVLFLDGDHSFEGLLADYEQWIEKLVVGGILLIDDVDDSEHLPSIIVFIESVITEEAFSDITIVDGILAAVKKDLGLMGHLRHLKECLGSDYQPLWDERSAREKSLTDYKNTSTTSFQPRYQKFSNSEYDILRDFCIYSRSLATTSLTISQDNNESTDILTSATEHIAGGQVASIKLPEQNGLNFIEESAQSWCAPIRLIYLDINDSLNLGHIINLWKPKFSQHCCVLVRKNFEDEDLLIKEELLKPPFRGMGYEKNIYWAIWMGDSEQQIVEDCSRDNRLSSLEGEIGAMKTSKFWKLREKWFAIKQLFNFQRY